MIAESGCKAIRYNGRLVADDLVLCCRLYGASLEHLRFSRVPKCGKERLGEIQHTRRPTDD